MPIDLGILLEDMKYKIRPCKNGGIGGVICVYIYRCRFNHSTEKVKLNSASIGK